MAGFGDLPMGDGSMFASAPQISTPAQQPNPSGGGGLFGFLYHDVVAPTVNAVSAIPGDIFHTGQALGTVGGSILSGHHGAQLAADKQKALDEIRQTTAGRSLPGTVSGVQSGSMGQQLEQIAGNVGNQALNATAPIAGGEVLAGKAGMAALRAGVGVGARLGALGGATNAMAQGQSAEQVAGAAGTGGILGGAAGAGGSLLGRGLAKLAGNKAASGGETAGTNLLDKLATKQAQTGYAQKVNSEFLGGKDAMVSDNGTPINSVLAKMNDHRIEPTVSNMAKFGNAGFAYNDILNNAIVPKGVPVPLNLDKVIGEAFNSQPGLGRVGSRGTQATQIAQGLRNTISNSLDPQGENISGIYHPADLLKAAQDLFNAKPASAAEGAVYAKARQGLIQAAGKEGGLNKAIEDYKLPSVADAFSTGAEDTQGARDTQHIVQLAGGNHTLSQEMIDSINGAKSIQDIQKAELPHIAANQIASKNAGAIGRMLPEAPSNTTGSFSTMGSPSSTMYATHEAIRNPLIGVPIAAARIGGNFIGKQLSKLGTADASQVGPRSIPSLEGSLDNGAMPHEPIPSAATVNAPTTPNPSGNIMSAIGGMGKGITSVGENSLRSASGIANAAMGTGAAQVGGAASNINTPQEVPTVDTAPVDQAVNQAAPQTGPSLDASTIPGGTLEDLQAEVQADPKNAATYEQIYNDAQKQVAASAPPKLNATQAKNLTNIQNATIALHNYVGGLNALSDTTRGAGVGHLSALMGKFGLGGTDAITASALESAKPELAIQLAQAMNNGQKPPQGLTKEIEGMLPGVGDPKALAAQKIQRLAENLSGYLQVATTASTADRSSGNANNILQALVAGSSQ